MGFNVGMTSSDFMMNAELRRQPDKSPPKVASFDPPLGNVGMLREVTVRSTRRSPGWMPMTSGSTAIRGAAPWRQHSVDIHVCAGHSS